MLRGTPSSNFPATSQHRHDAMQLMGRLGQLSSCMMPL